MSDMDKPQMTKYERISLILSGLAIVVSTVVVPYVGYRWLGSTREALRYVGRLEATYSFEGAETLIVRIENVGHQPVRNVCISVSPRRKEFQIGEVGAIKIFPPVPIEATIIGEDLFVDSGTTLGPEDEMEVRIPISFVPPEEVVPIYLGRDDFTTYVVSDIGNTKASSIIEADFVAVLLPMIIGPAE